MGRAAVTLGVVVLLIHGCTKPSPPQRIDGQIFIVTSGRANIRMGLVTVAVFPESTITAHIARRRQLAEPKVSELSSSLASAEAKLLEAEGLFRGEIRAADALDRASTAEPDPAKASERYFQSMNRLTQAGKYNSAIKRYHTEVDRLRIERGAWTSGVYLASNLPKPLTSTQTDADGNFSIFVPAKGQFIIVASSSRTTLGNEEFYAWIVRVPRDIPVGQRLLLSNENLTTADSPLSLVHTEN